MPDEVLRHFTITADPNHSDGRPRKPIIPVCITTGKIMFASRESVPPQCKGTQFISYFCAYCSAWHATHLSKEAVRKIRRRMGKKKLY